MSNNIDFFKEKGSLIDRIKIDLFNVIFVKYAQQYDADEQYREMRLRKNKNLFASSIMASMPYITMLTQII